MARKRAYVPPYSYEEVIWDDAASNAQSWVDIADIAHPERVITRGWVVKEEESFVSLASSVSMQEEYEDNVGNTMTIPKGMIVSRRKIKVSNARSKS